MDREDCKRVDKETRVDIARMNESTRVAIRKRCLRSLYNFCTGVMGYDDMHEPLHKKACEFLETTDKRKQMTLPRGYLKTCLASIAYPIWISLPRGDLDEFPYPEYANDKLYQLGTNVRVLVVSNVVTNANKIINKIKKVYERNQALMAFFPEAIPPDFSKGKWSDMSACINRTEDYTESTFEAAGVGGSAISRHYDIIIEDDLIYAKKDDLTGKELQPSQEDIDKAIGWHKLALSLFVPGNHTQLVSIGTRWAKHDLVDFIRKNEPSYKILDVSCWEKGTETLVWDDRTPTWPEFYGLEKLAEIRHAQGPYMFATQYENKPMSPEEMLFNPTQLQIYISDHDVPKDVRVFTTVDLAGWGKAKRSRMSRAVILTCAWDSRNHCWILHYDIGRLDPSDVIKVMAKHWKTFKPEKIGVEEVYYQKALSHFARKAMERGDVPWMTLRAIKPEGQESKDLRIRALEPLASNLAIHCKPTHREFIEEFGEYVPGSDSSPKDILDALAYQLRIARPGEPIDKGKGKRDPNPPVTFGTVDEFLKEVWKDQNPRDKFGNVGVMVDPFGGEDYSPPEEFELGF